MSVVCRCLTLGDTRRQSGAAAGIIMFGTNGAGEDAARAAAPRRPAASGTEAGDGSETDAGETAVTSAPGGTAQSFIPARSSKIRSTHLQPVCLSF